MVPDGPLIKAEKFPDLVKKLVDYRVSNGLPLGNPEQEILREYQVLWPYMVLPSDLPETKSPSDKFLKWSRFIRRAWRTPPKILTIKEASFRWDVCLTCPYNQTMDWPETQESAAMTQRAFLLRRGIETPKTLGFCGLHNADLSVLTFTQDPKTFSEKGNDEPNPKACWV